MENKTINTILLLLCALLVTGAGYYVTGVRQPAELQRIEDTRRVAELEKAEVEQLLIQEAATSEQAEEAVRRWRARYKFVPESMLTPDIVQYLEGLSSSGFEGLNVTLQGVQTTPDFSYYTFAVTGTASFSSLYHFVWRLENNREFYRVRDLSVAHQNVFKKNQATGLQRRLDMVKFSMTLDAYFAGIEGLSAREGELMPVPEKLLPVSTPAKDSFHPIVRLDLPPNDRLLVDVEKDRLVSILGTRAVFENEQGQHVLSEGDEVYLGSIVKVDPVAAQVRASLNKGGLVQSLNLKLETGEERYRQAQGDNELVPTTHEQ